MSPRMWCLNLFRPGERRIEVSYEGRTLPLVWMAYKSTAFDAKETSQMAMALACELAFGETSPIYKKLVLEEQVVEFINAQLQFPTEIPD